MLSQRAQIPVLKQGRVEKGNWSTRILTIDIATATVTISRNDHPNNVLYHSLKVTKVQLWPRFGQECIESAITSLKAKMTLRIAGKVVPVPEFSQEVTTVTEDTMGHLTDESEVTATRSAESESPVQQSLPSPSQHSAGGTSPVNNSPFAFSAGDCTKKSRALSEFAEGEADAWMIRFTTFKSYELALVLLQRMSRSTVVGKPLFGPHVVEDFVAVRAAWAQRKTIAGLDTEAATLT
ncbi:hypothetical protein ABB37_09124 [Leptomonas pyrrhocoris]|uniref:Uncharacterized protein n=1 Tax=Leptomonas pyrrhocoris TaxID=157538 RepID=A0A0N0DRP2_LEPPY|nr:hypothetical protein ABB37_09124 [Leptomonas pyrrhocoris]XP_015652870.1 hypothetical protein ABB37_09124 [Leptomonas pyrrhocoris]XP_015652871.1 hypothetical protein ABB37_09124 [Leptomonas pyrrhocoris]KPA74430.1 hypothetical protein ABB37_09124 [Leptomonas pyrrhocoris]KPA74431.1 hypothetical protein ABB37_09124 [Leptomonas pyrrhocoris]KPA74432.1 hypothetical protein ABB37_09124 [Leptomonas pyrrhocoris]|eukprot:XP_015652869.1 hypothetical protein ABB37_09124 [Leptomonas pyrrhocoris]